MKKILSASFVIAMLVFVFAPATKVAAIDVFTINTNTLPPATVGQTYATGIYYSYSGQDALNSTFTSLPPGLYTGTSQGSLTNTGMTPSSNGGIGTVYINGTPTQAGTYTFALYINDPSATGSTVAGTNKEFTIQVNPVGTTSTGQPITITTTNLPNATVGHTYSYQLEAAGIGTPFTWSFVASNYGCCTVGIEPSGIFSSNIAGPNTITASPGTYSFTFKVTDVNGNTADKTFAFIVEPAPTLTVTTSSLPNATVGQSYDMLINFSYNGIWALNACIAGLPTGLTGNGNVGANAPNCTYGLIPGLPGSTLAIRGTPTQAGTFNVYVTFDDQYGVTANKTFSLVVNSQTTTASITTTSLPSGVVGQSYSTSIHVERSGFAALNAYFQGLPPGITTGNAANPTANLGLVFPSVDIPLVGTPTQAGSFPVTLQLTDGYGTSISNKIFTLIVNPAGATSSAQSFTINTNTLPPATVGQTYATGIYYSYSGQDALNSTFTSLPPGLYTGTSQGSLTNTGMTPSSNGGIGTVYINGTPTQAGTYTFALYINDPSATGSTVAGTNKEFTIQVNPVGTTSIPPINPPTSGGVNLPDGTLLKFPGNPTVYLVTGGQLQPFTSAQDFLGKGFKWSDIQEVAPSQITTNQNGGSSASGSGLTMPSSANGPKLVKVADDPTVYFVTSNGLKLPMLSASVFLSYGHRWEEIQIIGQDQLDAYDTVDYIKLQGNARVYKLEGGVKRYITPAAAANLGIGPNQVVEVNQTEFYSYKTGSTIK